MIYIIQDYDTIDYVGTDFDQAKRHIKGSGTISVWKNGKWWGIQDRHGKWIFKTKHFIKELL
jgi:hypothetical protein